MNSKPYVRPLKQLGHKLKLCEKRCIAYENELNELHSALQVADGMLTLYFLGSHERKVVHETRLRWFKADENRR